MNSLQIKALHEALKILEEIDFEVLWADNFNDLESLKKAVDKHRISLQEQSQKRNDAINWIKALLDE